MISVLMYSRDRKELSELKKYGHEIAARLTEDDWRFFGYNEREQVYRFLSEHPLVDISCVDIAACGGIVLAEDLRRRCNEMYMVLLADSSVSPTAYIRPSIMAGSLLMRPLNVEGIKRVITEAALVYVKKISNSEESFLMIENKDGRQPVSYRAITFFESREKKIFANTSKKEYAFYDTLDNLKQRLPEGFVRCHRSFIVAKSRIKSIFISRGIIVLDDGSELPLSRSYKSYFKELK